jgi:hypothetical protein
MLQLIVAAKIISFSILVTLRMEVIYSSKMPVLRKAAWHNIPDDGILEVFMLITTFT